MEDMHEQQMSLCQSLRQYVFVHRAIIEGALMIVDEEKWRGAGSVPTAAQKTKQSQKAYTHILSSIDFRLSIFDPARSVPPHPSL